MATTNPISTTNHLTAIRAYPAAPALRKEEDVVGGDENTTGPRGDDELGTDAVGSDKITRGVTGDDELGTDAAAVDGSGKAPAAVDEGLAGKESTGGVGTVGVGTVGVGTGTDTTGTERGGTETNVGTATAVGLVAGAPNGTVTTLPAASVLKKPPLSSHDGPMQHTPTPS
jgi:hypothetical protein